MKRQNTILIFLCSLAGMWISCSSSDGDRAEKDYDEHNVMSSGCLNTRTDAFGFEEPEPYIVLNKEGNIISCELHNYDSNCISPEFKVDSEIKKSTDGLDTLTIDCRRVETDIRAHCTCQFNIYFVVRDVETDELFLKCGVSSYGYTPYEGMVSFKDSSTVTLYPMLTSKGYYEKTQILYREWVLEGYGSEDNFRPVEQGDDESRYFITLNPDSTMEGRNLCNDIHGTFECHGTHFTFDSYGGSKVYCIDEAAHVIDEKLPKVNRYLVDDELRLCLYYSGNEFFRFIPAP